MPANSPLSSLIDAELVQLYYQTHDQQIVSVLFLRYELYIYGACKRFLRNKEGAKDAAMNIYLLMVEQMKKYTIQVFKNWVYVLAKHYCFKLLKQKGGLVPMDDNTEWQDRVDLEKLFEKKELLKILQECLDKLKLEQKIAIKLFYLEQKTYFEIVDITRYEWNEVRSHVQNGKRNLKNCIEKNG